MCYKCSTFDDTFNPPCHTISKPIPFEKKKTVRNSGIFAKNWNEKISNIG